MTISEKMAYVKGLRDGVSLDAEKPEVRVIDAVLDLLGDVAAAIRDLDDQAEAVSDELDEIEESLDLLESVVYDEDDDEDDEDEEDDEADDEDEDQDADESDNDEAVYDFGDEVIYELTCPACGESITIDEEMLDKGMINCPKCGEELEFDLSEDEDSEK